MELDVSLCVTHRTHPVKVSAFVFDLRDGAIFPPVRAIHSDGRYYVTDGAHRVAAHGTLGLKVMANVIDIEDASDEELRLLGKRLYGYV